MEHHSIKWYSGEPIQVKPTWNNEKTGHEAATFAQKVNADIFTKFEEDEAFNSFRGVGWCTLHFEFQGNDQVKNENQSKNVKHGKAATLAKVFSDLLASSNRDHRVRKRKEGCTRLPWDADGEPWKLPNTLITVREILNCMSREDLACQEAWGAEWLHAVDNYMRPGGPWKAPFIRTICSKKTAKFDKRTSVLTLQFCVYVSRLVFYLIADPVLKTVFERMTPIGRVRGIGGREAYHFGKQVPATYKKSPRPKDQFTPGAVLQSQESTGYFPYCSASEGICGYTCDTRFQCDHSRIPGIFLKLKEYQSQGVQWMLDMETLDHGLNGLFWERRMFGDPSGTDRMAGGASEELKDKDAFYYSSILGELRIGSPLPMVRGGLLCDEMGLGKTLQIVSLIKASRTRKQVLLRRRLKPPSLSNLAADFIRSKATLVIAPDHLIHQWVREIRKSCSDDDMLSVKVFNASDKDAKQAGLAKRLASYDVVITSYKDTLAKVLNQVFWERVVVDEMQEIRSSTTKIAKACGYNGKICAASRWMVSGTPLFSGLNDLNGELNFLGVIPFCMRDSVDGFWSAKVAVPFKQKDQLALDMLDTLLSNVMIRRSKRQRRLDNNRLLLDDLVPKTVLYRPVPLAGPHELATYAFVEALATSAFEHTMPEGNPAGAHAARLAARVAELLRRLAVSPALVHGGWGAPGRLAPLNEIQRSMLVLRQGGAGGLLSAATELPANQLLLKLLMPQEQRTLAHEQSAGMVRQGDATHRNRYVSALGNGGGVSALAGKEMALQRLEQASEKLARAKLDAEAALVSAKGGRVPRERWAWAAMAVTSGKYLALQMLRSPRGVRTAASKARTLTPLLTSRALRIVAALRRVDDLQVRLEVGELQLQELRTAAQEEAALLAVKAEGGGVPVKAEPNAIGRFGHDAIERLMNAFNIRFGAAGSKRRRRVKQERGVQAQDFSGIKKVDLSHVVGLNEEYRRVHQVRLGTVEADILWQQLELLGIRKKLQHWTYVWEKDCYAGVQYIPLTKKWAIAEIGDTPVYYREESSPKWFLARSEPVPVSRATMISVERMDGETVQVHPFFVAVCPYISREDAMSFVPRSGEFVLRSIMDKLKFDKTIQEKLMEMSNGQLKPILELSNSKLEELLRNSAEESSSSAVNNEVVLSRCNRFQTELSKRVIDAVALELHTKGVASDILSSLYPSSDITVTFDEIADETSKYQQLIERAQVVKALQLQMGNERETNGIDKETVIELFQLKGPSKPMKAVTISRAIGNDANYRKLAWNAKSGRSSSKRKQLDDGEDIGEELSQGSTVQGTGSGHASMRKLKEAIDKTVSSANKGIALQNDLETYTKLLSKAILAYERYSSGHGEISVANLEQQGMQALQQMSETEFDNFVDDPLSPCCAICLEKMENPVCTGCVHLFCMGCLDQHCLAMTHLQPQAASNGSFPCPLCRQVVHAEDLVRVLPPDRAAPDTSLGTQEKMDREQRLRQRLKQWVDRIALPSEGHVPSWTPGATQSVADRLLSRVSNTSRHHSLEALPPKFLGALASAAGVHASQAGASQSVPSKVNAVASDIEQVMLDEDGTGKVVVFSQFPEAILHLCHILEQRGIRVVSIIKGRKRDLTSSAVQSFMSDPQVRVLAIHAGAAAAGLTLTRARHVIMLEPFMRAGEEAQAISRVHRIGQTRPVEARVYYVPGTIEERILALRKSNQSGDESDDDDDLTTLLTGEVSVESLSKDVVCNLIGVANDLDISL